MRLFHFLFCVLIIVVCSAMSTPPTTHTLEGPTTTSVQVTLPFPALAEGEVFSTYLYSEVSGKAWDMLQNAGVLRHFFVTEWSFLAPGGAQMIQGLKKWERYLLGLEPYDLEKLQTVINERLLRYYEQPEVWDPCICLNYEDCNGWLSWKASNDQEREDALAQFSRVLGRALSAIPTSEPNVKLGPWGSLSTKRNGACEVVNEWRTTAAYLGTCCHLSGYYGYASGIDHEWLKCQIEHAILAGFNPQDIRVWIAPYGLQDRIPFSPEELRSIGAIIAGYGAGIVLYDDRLRVDLGVKWGDPVPPEIQRIFDRWVLVETRYLIEGMNSITTTGEVDAGT